MRQQFFSMRLKPLKRLVDELKQSWHQTYYNCLRITVTNNELELAATIDGVDVIIGGDLHIHFSVILTSLVLMLLSTYPTIVKGVEWKIGCVLLLLGDTSRDCW